MVIRGRGGEGRWGEALDGGDRERMQDRSEAGTAGVKKSEWGEEREGYVLWGKPLEPLGRFSNKPHELCFCFSLNLQKFPQKTVTLWKTLISPKLLNFPTRSPEEQEEEKMRSRETRKHGM